MSAINFQWKLVMAQPVVLWPMQIVVLYVCLKDIESLLYYFFIHERLLPKVYTTCSGLCSNCEHVTEPLLIICILILFFKIYLYLIWVIYWLFISWESSPLKHRKWKNSITQLLAFRSPRQNPTKSKLICTPKVKFSSLQVIMNLILKVLNYFDKSILKTSSAVSRSVYR
jgi:hypothetical protein